VKAIFLDCGCPLPAVLESRIERSCTGVLKRCFLCEYCGRWKAFSWTEDGSLAFRPILVATGRFPARPPSIYTFSVRIPWNEIRKRWRGGVFEYPPAGP
jgi:hypothetical protein